MPLSAEEEKRYQELRELHPETQEDKRYQELKELRPGAQEEKRYQELRELRKSIQSETPDASFATKNPNLYGAYGAGKEVAKSFVPFLKYVDEEERNELTNLLTAPEEKNIMEGLASDDPKGYYLQNLERGVASDVNMLLGYMAGGAAIKPIAKATGAWMQKYTPTFYKILTTKIGQKSPATVAQRIKQYRAKHGENPSNEIVEGWWSEAAKKSGAKTEPPTLEWGTSRSGSETAAPATKEFWSWYNSVGKEEANKQGYRVFKNWHGEWVVSRKKGVIPAGATSTTEATEPTVVDRLLKQIKKAEPLRETQEAMYTAERGRRAAMGKKAGEKLTGQARWRAETKALGGEMPKPKFEPFVLGPEDTDELFGMIHKKLPDFWNQRTAGRGLEKIFTGEIPQRGELAFLRQVYGDDLVKALLSKRSTFEKMKELGLEAINVPRAIMASFDLSAPLRQGLFLGPSHPKRFAQSFVKMFRQFGSKKAFNAVQDSLVQKKWYGLLKKHGLEVTEIGGGLTAREEAFMGANLAEKIPAVGRVVAASNRAYTGFLNKLRVDVADDLMEKAAKAGFDPKNNPDLVEQIARFVNAASGRGKLRGAFEKSAVLLNSTFFSPRLMSSRLTLLNPEFYVRNDPFVRKQALKSLFAFTGAIGSVLGLAKMGGAKVGTDPRSANFGKIRINNTRIDVMGGFQQYIRAAGQLVSGKYISSTTGREYTLGEGYKPLTRLGIIGRQAESKLSPPASFAVSLLRGHDIHGEKISVPKEIGKRFVPMVAQDVYDLAIEDPELLPLAVLGVFGVGLQTYGPKEVIKPKFNKPRIKKMK